MESLEVRRLRLYLLQAYKVLFGLVHVSTDDLLIPSDNNSHRGLCMPISQINMRINSYSIRVMRVWNSLPDDKVDFSFFTRFRKSLTTNTLIKYCMVYFC